MSFAKLTFDKPIPVSPLIALDRERCILCYRCTRFSEDVAEDGQLIARNRGARTEIATFEDEPYRSPFSGNVVELCPVGALTSTLYRFDARPWDIQNVPTVCTGCAVGCNTSATIREGKVKRILSRNHPGDRPRLALRQGPLLVPAPARRRPHHRAATPREEGARGDLLGRRARRGRGDAARVRRVDRHGALGLGDDRDRVRARAARCAVALGAHSAVLAGGDVGRRSRRSAFRSARSPRRRSSSWSATIRSSSARRSSTSGSRKRAGVAPRSSSARRRARRRSHPAPARESCRELAAPEARSRRGCEPRSAPFSSGRAQAEAAERGSPSSRTSSGSRASRAAARSIFRLRRTRAASRCGWAVAADARRDETGADRAPRRLGRRGGGQSGRARARREARSA